MVRSSAAGPRPGTSHDAVVVIPGIMGSALRDLETGHYLWGLRSLTWYRQAWTTGASLRALRLTDAEREGSYGRVQPAGLLRFPAWAPLTGFEPYTRLVDGVRTAVADSAAVLEFAYDWRLPVEYNAELLAQAARQHLDTWRASPAHAAARRLHPDEREARLVLIAHSMGGLVAKAVRLVEGTNNVPAISDDIRATITLGTPFEGAAKAAFILSAGDCSPVPLPRGRLRSLATTMPGLYDLLPIYRCVDTGNDVRRLSTSDIVGLGGDPHLADRSFDFHGRLADSQIVGHRSVIGVEQPTLQTLRLRDGVAEGLMHTFRVHADGALVRDRQGMLVRISSSGDGTVPRNSASLTGAPIQYEAQQHGSLAKVDEIVTFVRAVITEEEAGARLGAGHFGVGVPDVVEPNAVWPITVTGIDSPTDVTCVVIDAETGLQVDAPNLQLADGEWQSTTSVPDAHLYQVVVSGGSGSPVTRYVLAAGHD